jgi:hypothetical protein
MRLHSQNTGKASGSQRLPSWGITLPKRPDDGELLTIQNPSPTLASFSNFRKAWDNLTANIDWWAPRVLYWICGKQVYTVLPSRWFGSFMLGSIGPSFSCFPSDKVKNWESPYINKY